MGQVNPEECHYLKIGDIGEFTRKIQRVTEEIEGNG